MHWPGGPCRSRPRRGLPESSRDDRHRVLPPFPGKGREGSTTRFGDLGWAQRPKAPLHLFCEEVRLFPRREMTTAVKLVVVDQLWIGALRPAARSLVLLAGEDAHCHRD